MVSETMKTLWVCLSILASLGTEAHAEARFSPFVEVSQRRANVAEQLGVARSTHLYGVISLKQALTPGLRTELETLGVEFHHVNGRILKRGMTVPAKIALNALTSLRHHSAVGAIEAYPNAPQPLFVDQAHISTELPPAWRGRDLSGDFLTGKGVVVGNIDSEIDVFHPEFFHADGGLYEWVDANLDNQFTPGVDSVVMEEGGEALPLQFLDSTLIVNPMDIQPNMPPPPGDGFQADRDWIYLDLNGNGKRDVGPSKGFSDDTPAFGEPLFIADDINENGFIDPGEKLIRLKTSKIRAVYGIEENLVWRRGTNLINVPRPKERAHGTMTVGVLAGGHWSRLYRGVAPDAEIVFADYNPGGDGSGGEGVPITAGLVWLEEEGVDIMMHEYGAPIGVFGDGSSEHETLMDSMHDLGIPQCTATHNFGGYPGHNVVSVGMGGSTSIMAQVGGPLGESIVHYWTLRWREPLSDLAFHVVLPDGQTATLEAEPQELMVGEHMIAHSGIAMSSRGTYMAVIFVGRVVGDAWVPLEPSFYEIVAQAKDESSGTLDVWLNDEHGYLLGSSLTDWGTEGTLAHPSTADSAIGVGALFSNVEMQSPLKEVTFYSGRGPRIDGELGIDVVAPADGLAADSGSIPDADVVMNLAGGTSGALPQVTGVVALLKQLEPEISSDQVVQRLQNGAWEDDFTDSTPNNDWGYGKLSAYGTLFEAPAPWENVAPTIVMEFPVLLEMGTPAELFVGTSTDPDHPQESLRVRWDVDYTGLWTSLEPIGSTILVPPPDEASVRYVVVEVSDSLGAFSRRLIKLTWLEELPKPEPEPEPMPEVAEDVISPDSLEDDVAGEGVSLDAADDSKINGTKQSTNKVQGCGGCSARSGGDVPAEAFIFGLIALFLLRRRHA